jgi:hypothetical protein
MQLTIFTPLSQRIVDRIEATDVNSLTPLQALNLLEELQQELKEQGMTAKVVGYDPAKTCARPREACWWWGLAARS